MPLYLFDTCALKYRYLDQSPSATIPPAQFKAIRRRIRLAISHPKSRCFIAENTMFELSSALGGALRGRVTWKTEQFDRMMNMFLHDVATERLIVRKPDTREFRRIRHLLRYVGVIKRRNLSSLDAIVASAAVELAYEHKEKVTIYTGDKGLHSVVTDVEPFKSVLVSRFIL
jgi:rRNA maturation endonuclease Nob1